MNGSRRVREGNEASYFTTAETRGGRWKLEMGGENKSREREREFVSDLMNFSRFAAER